MTTTQTTDRAVTEEAPTMPSNNPGPLSVLFFGLALLCVFGLLAVGMKNTFFPDNSRLDQIEHKVDSLTTEVSVLRNQATSTTTLPPVTTEPAVAETPAPFYEDYTMARSRELAKMPLDECQKIDHYAYFGSTYPRVDSTGATFHYDCVTHYWGWYYAGTAADKWTPTPVLDSDLTPGLDKAKLSISHTNPPANHRHPKFANALTLSELRAGLTVCIRYLPADGKTTTNPTELIIEGVYTSVYRNPVTHEIDAWPAFTYKGATLKGGSPDRSLAEAGVISYHNGLWSTSYMTAGAC